MPEPPPEAVEALFQQAADLEAQVDVLAAAPGSKFNQGQANALKSHLKLKNNNGDSAKVQQFLKDVAGLASAGILTQAQADALSGPGNTLLLSVTRL